MINDQRGLDELVEALTGQPVLAVDCEMDAMYAYRTSLCVVQIGWPGREALVDARAPLAMEGLGRLFGDPGVIKVFHGGENDIGLMRSQWGIEFERIFDTMAAARITGRKSVSLAALLEEHFDVQVSKKFQKADWRVRPLPADQAEYARVDVRYLIDLRASLRDELEELGRVAEARSEFTRIARARYEAKPFDPDNWGRIKGVRELPPARRAVLAALFEARDAIARRRDRAPYRVMHEGALLQLARRPPASREDLAERRGIGRGLPGEDLETLWQAVLAGKDRGVIDLPRPPRRGARGSGEPRLSAEQAATFDALRRWRQTRAAERGVEVSLVAPNALLEAIVRAAPRTPEELAAVDGVEPWRVDEYGAQILAVLRNGRDA